MSALRLTAIATILVGSLAMGGQVAIAAEMAPNFAAVKFAAANDVVEVSCCGWGPGWFFGGYYPPPTYYGGPLSGATYAYYYGSYWGRPHWRYRRHRLMK